MVPKVILLMEDIAPSQYFIYYPLLNLHRNGKIKFKLNLESRIKNIYELNMVDLVIFSRNHSRKTIEIIKYLQKFKIPYIFEIDDDLYRYPIDYPYQKHITEDSLTRLTRVITGASLVRVFSPIMVERVKKMTTAFRLQSPPIFWSLIKRTERNRDKLRIHYATSRIEGDPLFEIIDDALKIIRSRYKETVEIVFWGYLPLDFKNLRNIKYIPFMRNYMKFMKKFSKSANDIGLAPMSNNLFCQAKTNNKHREYGACRIAGIYSNVELYKGIVNGETGILVENNTADWVSAISLLVEDTELRKKIIENAYLKLWHDYSEEDYIRNWENDIFRVINHTHVSENSIDQNEETKNQATNKKIKKSRFRDLRDSTKIVNYCKWLINRVLCYFSNTNELINMILQVNISRVRKSR